MNEDEFRAVDTIAELFGGQCEVALHFCRAVIAISSVSGRVERVFDGFPVTSQPEIVRIEDAARGGAVGVFCSQVVAIGAGFCWPLPSRVEQEELIVDILDMLKGGVLLDDACECAGSQGEVLEVVLFDESRVVKSIHDDEV